MSLRAQRRNLVETRLGLGREGWVVAGAGGAECGSIPQDIVDQFGQLLHAERLHDVPPRTLLEKLAAVRIARGQDHAAAFGVRHLGERETVVAVAQPDIDDRDIEILGVERPRISAPLLASAKSYPA